MLEHLLGYDPADPLSFPVQLDTHFLEAVEQPPERTLRIAFSRDLGCDFAIDEDVLAAIEGAAERLAHDGFSIEEADPQWPAGTFEYPLLPLQQAGLAALFGARWQENPEMIDPDLGPQIELGLASRGPDIAQMLLHRDRLHRCLSDFFGHYDLLLCPTAPVTAWSVTQNHPLMIGGKPATPRGHAAYTPLFNYCGVPACSVPCGLAANGLPVGIQVIGPRFGDARVLSLAAVIEAQNEIDFSRPRTPLATQE